MLRKLILQSLHQHWCCALFACCKCRHRGPGGVFKRIILCETLKCTPYAKRLYMIVLQAAKHTWHHQIGSRSSHKGFTESVRQFFSMTEWATVGRFFCQHRMLLTAVHLIPLHQYMQNIRFSVGCFYAPAAECWRITELCLCKNIDYVCSTQRGLLSTVRRLNTSRWLQSVYFCSQRLILNAGLV